MLEILKTLNILYAEDDSILQNTIKDTFTILCNNTYYANDGLEALEYFDNERIDIIILDYVMPILDGYEVAKKIREKDRNIPIIMSSGYCDKEKLLKAIELNLITYIEKPLTYSKLITALENAVKSLEQNNRLEVSLEQNIKYDYVNKIILKDDIPIQLSKQEVKFLELLLQRRNNLFSKEIVEQEVFGDYVEPNTMRNMVYRLRKKLDTDLIITIKDLGYLIK
ncbi:MAG: response regulator transcription factor [Campylobacterota bacterium]